MPCRTRLITLLAACVFVMSTNVAAIAADWGPVTIARQTIEPGEKKKFTFIDRRTFEGGFIDFGVFAARGSKPGPMLCITSGIHGDEINSTEIARRSFAEVDPKALSGTLVVLPAINASGFRTMNRYMPDRRDLNRAFPGSPNGSVAAIVADAVFSGVIRGGCTHLIDLHTGSNYRTNMPQIRADAASAETMEMARRFGVGVIVSSAGPKGSLRREAMRVGIPAIIYEAGPPYVFVEPEIVRGAQGIRNVMAYLGMLESKETPPQAHILRDSRWIRVPRGKGGIYLPVVKLGDSVTPGQLLATVTDPISDVSYEIRSESPGVIVGMALPQVVLSGYGLLHIGELNQQ
jgi:predicted deacylase